MTVEDKDRGWSALGKSLKSMAGDPHVLVGVQGPQADAPHGEGLTNVQVASFNEFGTTNDDGTVATPERSFIRATIDRNEARLLKRLAQVGRAAALGKMTPGVALELSGEECRGMMVESINHRIDPPNKPSTIARKGSDVPLIERAQLKNSLTYKPVLP